MELQSRSMPFSHFAGWSKMPSSLFPENVRQVHLVGHKIRELRKERRLTQVELSSRLGIQQSDLSRMEKGEYRVSLDTLFKILSEFKMGIGEFFEPGVDDLSGERAARVVQDFNTLPEDAQKEVQEFIAFKRSQRIERRREERQEEP